MQPAGLAPDIKTEPIIVNESIVTAVRLKYGQTVIGNSAVALIQQKWNSMSGAC